jgi:probable rRNA maturation factor
MSPPRLRIALQRAVRPAWLPDGGSIRAWAATALGSVRAGEMTVRIVGDAESAALNERYRGRSGATNVLAFPSGAAATLPDGELEPLGDLVICAPLVEREAAEQGKAVEAHFAHLVVHGTLHLVGFDHDEEAAARAMESRERDVLASFGFADPYADEADALRHAP